MSSFHSMTFSLFEGNHVYSLQKITVYPFDLDSQIFDKYREKNLGNFFKFIILLVCVK